MPDARYVRAHCEQQVVKLGRLFSRSNRTESSLLLRGIPLARLAVVQLHRDQFPREQPVSPEHG